MTQHILTTDTAAAPDTERYVAHLEAALSKQEGLLGAWVTTYGPLNRVLFLQQAGESGPAPPPSTPPDDLILQRRHRKLLREVKPFRPTEPRTIICELRVYDVAVGACAEFLSYMLPAIKIRENYSPNCGIWESQSGRTDQVIHIWTYESLAHRHDARKEAYANPDWQFYVPKMTGLIQSMTSTLMSPILG